MNKEIGPSVWYDTHRRQADAPTPAHLDEILGHHEPLNEDDKAALRAMQAEVVALRAGAALAATQPNAAPGDGQGATPDDSTPGLWFVRKRERDGEILDCFVAAPDCQGLPYDAEILGDDEYRETTPEGHFSIRRKLADCELIVKAVAFYRAHLAAPSTATAAREQEAPDTLGGPIYIVMQGRRRTAIASLRENAEYAAKQSILEPTPRVVACRLVPIDDLASHNGAPAAPSAEGPEQANMFWNDADPERSADSIHEVIEREWSDGMLQIGDVLEIQRAVRLSNIKVELIPDPQDEDGFDYVVMPQPIAGSGGISSKEEA